MASAYASPAKFADGQWLLSLTGTAGVGLGVGNRVVVGWVLVPHRAKVRSLPPVYEHDDDVCCSVASSHTGVQWLIHEHDRTEVPLGHVAVDVPLQNRDKAGLQSQLGSVLKGSLSCKQIALLASEPTVTSVGYAVLEHVATAVAAPPPLETAEQVFPMMVPAFEVECAVSRLVES